MPPPEDPARSAPAEPLYADVPTCLALEAAALEVAEACRVARAVLGLNEPQGRLLLLLWEADGVALDVAAHRLGLDVEALLADVEAVERAGLAERDGEGDTSVEVWLTPEGHRLRRRCVPMPPRLRSCLDALRLRGPLSSASGRAGPTGSLAAFA